MVGVGDCKTCLSVGGVSGTDDGFVGTAARAGPTAQRGNSRLPLATDGPDRGPAAQVAMYLGTWVREPTRSRCQRDRQMDNDHGKSQESRVECQNSKGTANAYCIETTTPRTASARHATAARPGPMSCCRATSLRSGGIARRASSCSSSTGRRRAWNGAATSRRRAGLPGAVQSSRQRLALASAQNEEGLGPGRGDLAAISSVARLGSTVYAGE